MVCAILMATAPTIRKPSNPTVTATLAIPAVPVTRVVARATAAMSTMAIQCNWAFSSPCWLSHWVWREVWSILLTELLSSANNRLAVIILHCQVNQRWLRPLSTSDDKVMWGRKDHSLDLFPLKRTIVTIDHHIAERILGIYLSLSFSLISISSPFSLM